MVEPIKVEEVVSVYSGKAHHCCCGCAGKHTYASAYRKDAAKIRGYPIEDEEVNDVVVRRLVTKINANLDKVKHDKRPMFLSVVIGSRVYVAYLVERIR